MSPFKHEDTVAREKSNISQGHGCYNKSVLGITFYVSYPVSLKIQNNMESEYENKKLSNNKYVHFKNFRKRIYF